MHDLAMQQAAALKWALELYAVSAMSMIFCKLYISGLFKNTRFAYVMVQARVRAWR